MLRAGLLLSLASLGWGIGIGSNGDEPFTVPPDAASAPAVRYARLDRASAATELGRRGVSFSSVASARGVLAPVRLTGPLAGVTYRSPLSAAARASAAIEIFDCRLALALHDFSTILRRYDVVEVVHLSAYRPPPA